MKFIFSFTLLLCCALFSFATEKEKNHAKDKNMAPEDFRMVLVKAPMPIKIDGELDDEAWAFADVASEFQRHFPVDEGLSGLRTEVRLMYDNDFLYVGVVCYTPPSHKTIVQTLRRDFNYNQSDSFSFFLDPFDDRTNGFTFSVNPLGGQREGLISNISRIDVSWDNKWFSETRIYEDKWTAEIAIPFKSIRFNEHAKGWNINFARNDVETNERSTWVPVPQQFYFGSLAFGGRLTWNEEMPGSKANVAVIPYLSGNTSRDYVNSNRTSGMGIGADAKVGVTSSLNLDLTVNPDFSQVEVDQQVTNLDRFELFFPERRQFFIENSDLFSNFGFSRIRPFFSRRIGLNAPIIAGARLSGKMGSGWRVGLMNMQTNTNEELGQAGHNFSVAAVQRQVFARSNIAAIIVNKQTNILPTDSVEAANALNNQFNRLVGLDYNLSSKNNRWNGKFFVHKTISPERKGGEMAHAAYLSYSTRNVYAAWNHEIVGANYNAEVGFVPRRGYVRVEPFIRYYSYPQSSIIYRHGPYLRGDLFVDMDGRITDRNTALAYRIQFVNTGSIYVETRQNYVVLFRPFDPTNSGGIQLPVDSAHEWFNVFGNFSSDYRKKFAYSANASYGGFYNGKRKNVGGNLSYRVQPYGSLALDFSYNDIDLPEPFSDARFMLIGPRMDLSLTDNIFVSTFVQYNDQIDNININARLQWRFKPVSDFFVVYTDNYLPEDFSVKNRALILKLSYWLNV